MPSVVSLQPWLLITSIHKQYGIYLELKQRYKTTQYQTENFRETVGFEPGAPAPELGDLINFLAYTFCFCWVTLLKSYQ